MVIVLKKTAYNFYKVITHLILPKQTYKLSSILYR